MSGQNKNGRRRKTIVARIFKNQARLKPFFSIIMPVCNGASSISAAIESIVTQGFDRYEIIFIDGVSTDATLEIIAAFRQTASGMQIKLLSEPDAGIYDAMNKGISMAAGDWLYFMGSDDRLHSNGVLHQVCTALQQENADLLYGNVEGVSSKINYRYDTVAKVLAKGIHHQSVFYKASLFSGLGAYDLQFKIAADYHFTLKVFLNEAYKTKYINIDISFYGEAGLSSQVYDYPFYSYHYKFLALNNGIRKIDDPLKCLETSIYCCMYLAKEKNNLLFAWKNLFFYLTGKNPLSGVSKIKTLARMMRWTLTPVKKACQG